MTTTPPTLKRLEADEFLAIFHILGPERTRYVTKAVSSHDALLAALKDIAEQYKCETPGCMCIGGDDEYCVGATALAAVAATKEGEA